MAYFRKISTKTRGERWEATVCVAPHPRVCRRFDRLQEARTWADIETRHLKSSRHRPEVNSQLSLFTELVDHYLSTLPEPLSRYHRDQKQMLSVWAEKIGAIPLAYCTPAVVSAAMEEIAGKHFRKRKPATVILYIDTLNVLFNKAVRDWGLMQKNPIRKISRPKIKKKRERFLSDEEVKLLLIQCRKCTRKPLFLIVLLALSTGARKQEILSLQWSCIDLETGDARLPETKTDTPRTIYIRQAALRELRRYAADADRRGYVFRHKRTHRKHIRIDKEWRKARDDSGIEEFRFHDLRHTFASWMSKDGANLLDIQAALGHTNPKTTQRYAHLTRSHIASTVDATNEIHLTIEGLT